MIDSATKRHFHKVVLLRTMSWLEWKYWQVLRKLSIELDFYIRTHKPVEVVERIAIQPIGAMIWQ